VSRYFQMYRVNPLWGDIGIALFLTLVILIASITYLKIEVPWRSFGRGLASRAFTDVIRAEERTPGDGTRDGVRAPTMLP
jgi:hypothetical protein